MPEQQRIIAVVVTYNRLGLLQRLVERLDQVPELAEVLVIDNASSDGTGEWLAGLPGTMWHDEGDEHPATPVVGRTLTDNLGGAGGFAQGLTWAHERGADLVWLMDDDGLPATDCLGLLLEKAHQEGGLDFWGPVVVDEAAPDRLVFPIRLPGGTRVVHRMADVEAAATGGLLRDIVIPFNGVLVTRELVERIGVPRAEFFIWGDDHEYRLRAEAAGARIATVVAARVQHPAVGELGTPMMLGRTTYNHSPSDLKHYCMARNNALNLKAYRGWAHVALFVVKTIWFYLFTRPQPGRIALSLQAWWAAARGDFSGHRRFLSAPVGSVASTGSAPVGAAAVGSGPGGSGSVPSPNDRVAIAVVTYNRADLLERMLAGLAQLERPADAVVVVDNASTDRTAQVLATSDLPGLQVITSETNLGGAGGFRTAVKAAYEQGFDRVWLMDDDVIPAPDALAVLLSQPAQDSYALTSVREDSAGALVEKAALRFDLTNPLAIKPKTAMVETTFGDRAAMPERVPVENVAFEGFLVHRSVIERIGLPDASYFIFYDDVDFALRARNAGYTINAVRDAVLVRQLDFSQQHDLAGWKGFYMYRNLFAVHFRYGTNPLVRAKPYLLAAGVVVLSPVRGGRREAGNVVRALRAARAMRQVPGTSVD